MSPAQHATARDTARLLCDIRDLAESVRVDLVAGSGRLIPHLAVGDLHRLLPRILRRAVRVDESGLYTLTSGERVTLRGVAGLIEDHGPNSGGYCEHCGSGPSCVVCGREDH